MEGDRLVDHYVLPVGIRTVRVEGAQFLLNGTPFYFRGFGMHEDLNVRGRGHDEASMVHDFALTATKVIFVLPPIVLPRIPVGLTLGQRSFAESLRYRPELGVDVVVVDRATGETRWLRTEQFMMFHTVNAWDDGDDVVVDVCAYPDGGIMHNSVGL